MNLPNLLTLFRILLVPFFFTELVSYRDRLEIHRIAAFALFALACLTDALDGAIARLTRTQTALGRFLDPLADKLLILSGYIGLLFVNNLAYHPPLWITVAIIFRDLLLIGGLGLIHMLTGNMPIAPNLLGKATTFFQMITLAAILLQTGISVYLWNVTAFLTVASCLIYIFREMRRI